MVGYPEPLQDNASNVGSINVRLIAAPVLAHGKMLRPKRMFCILIALAPTMDARNAPITQHRPLRILHRRIANMVLNPINLNSSPGFPRRFAQCLLQRRWCS